MNGCTCHTGYVPERSAGSRGTGTGGLLFRQLHSLQAAFAGSGGDALKVAKININFDLPLAEQYEVQAAPTLIFFKNGAEQDRRRGLVKKAELQEIIDSLK